MNMCCSCLPMFTDGMPLIHVDSYNCSLSLQLSDLSESKNVFLSLHAHQCMHLCTVMLRNVVQCYVMQNIYMFSQNA